MNRETQDEIRGSVGEHILRGKVDVGGRIVQVQAFVKMGFFGTKYRLLVDGREHPMQRVK